LTGAADNRKRGKGKRKRRPRKEEWASEPPPHSTAIRKRSVKRGKLGAKFACGKKPAAPRGFKIFRRRGRGRGKKKRKEETSKIFVSLERTIGKGAEKPSKCALTVSKGGLGEEREGKKKKVFSCLSENSAEDGGEGKKKKTDGGG